MDVKIAKCVVSFFLMTLVTQVKAGWYVGTRNPPDTVMSSNVALSYINPTTSVTIPAFKGGGMFFVASGGACNSETTPHYTWTYVSIPSRQYFTNNSYIEFEGIGSYIYAGIADGQKRYYEKTRRDWSWGTTCTGYNPGTSSGSDTWMRPQMVVSAKLHDGGDIVPGVKRIEVPLRVAQVAATSDSGSISGALNWANANVHKLGYISTMWVIEATITPRCWVSANALTLKHGSIQVNQVNGHLSNQQTLNISCNTLSSVDVELVAMDPDVEYGSGATKCGDGLVCVVTMDGGLTERKYTSVTSITTTLQSKLISNSRSGSIHPGAFKGSVVLRINYK